jgi:hypothetical protein
MDTLDGTKLSDFKQLRCDRDKRHIIGIVQRVSVNIEMDGTTFQYYSPRLLIFRATVDMGADIPAEIDVAGSIEGRTLLNMGWKCSVPGCGGIRKWFPEKELIEHFVRTYLAE